jgi:hypothetical protein
VIQLTAILAVWLGMYYPGLDIVLAFFYLLIIWKEASSESVSFIRQFLIGFVWQVPAMFLSLTLLLGLDQSTDFSYYYIFILQLWHTPLLPLTTLLPNLIYMERPFYYYELFLFAPLLWIIYLLPLVIHKKSLHKKINPLA